MSFGRGNYILSKVYLWEKTKEMSRVEARKKPKKKSSNNTVYYVIMIILFAIMGFSGFKVYKIASEYKQGTSVYDGIAEDVGAAPRG